MGYRLITQGVLIIASLVIIVAFVQPTFSVIKDKQSELQQYTDTIDRVAQFNMKLQELIQKRDSFSRQDMQALERFIPTEIDSLKIMSEIAGIFSSRGITVTSMIANDVADPLNDVAFENTILAQSAVPNLDLSYQDYEVVFVATYDQLRDILILTEASNSLLEVVELSFDAVGTSEVDREGNVVPSQQGKNDALTVKLILRTFGLPVNTNS